MASFRQIAIVRRFHISAGIGFITALACSLFSAHAFAQSSVAVPMNAATGRSIADAVAQNQNELLDREVFGNPAAGQQAPVATSAPGGAPAQLGGPPSYVNGPGSGGTAAVSSALAGGAMPTGRLRTSEHEGLTPAAADQYSYKTHEASAFANVVIPVPGTVLGGQLRFTVLAGTNRVSLGLKSNEHAILDPNQFAKADNESLFAGGSALWASQGTYAVATVIGFRGETNLVDGVDNCNTNGCLVGRYKFGTSGFIGSVAAGRVFDLAGASGPKLDVRGTVGYMQNRGDSFKQFVGFDQSYRFSTWTGTAGLTLFTNITLRNNAILRPYIQAQVRQEWDYRNVLDVTKPDGSSGGSFSYGQNHTFGGLTAGMTYNLDRMTLGAAVYTEASGDDRTYGGRLGASLLLGGEVTPRANIVKPAAPPALVNWTGFYLGVHAGNGSADVGLTNRGPDNLFAPVGGSDKTSANGWLGGGQAGYNWQIGSIVVGVEGASSILPFKQDRTGTFAPFLGGFNGDHWISDVSQIYSITGRLGLAVGNWLPYIKGGFAGAAVETSMTHPGVPNLISSSLNWHTGWTIGGGVEYMFAPNWTLGLAYDRYSFNSENASALRTGDPASGGGVTDNWSANPDIVQTITARMNFKFN